MRGFSLYQVNQYKLAIDDTTKAIDSDPNYQKVIKSLSKDTNISKAFQMPFINPYLIRADSYRILKQYNLALSDYSKLISIIPDVGMFYFQRGLIYQTLKIYKFANVDFKKAKELGYEQKKEKKND